MKLAQRFCKFGVKINEHLKLRNPLNLHTKSNGNWIFTTFLSDILGHLSFLLQTDP